MIRFGRCQCCELLKDEVSFLRSLVRPKPETKHDPLPIVHMEQDAIMSGTEDQIILTDEEKRRQDEIASEQARVLSGTY